MHRTAHGPGNRTGLVPQGPAGLSRSNDMDMDDLPKTLPGFFVVLVSGRSGNGFEQAPQSPQSGIESMPAWGGLLVPTCLGPGTVSMKFPGMVQALWFGAARFMARFPSSV